MSGTASRNRKASLKRKAVWLLSIRNDEMKLLPKSQLLKELLTTCSTKEEKQKKEAELNKGKGRGGTKL